MLTFLESYDRIMSAVKNSIKNKDVMQIDCVNVMEWMYIKYERIMKIAGNL